MTIATVITNVANEAGYTVESNIFTSNETTTKQLLASYQRPFHGTSTKPFGIHRLVGES